MYSQHQERSILCNSTRYSYRTVSTGQRHFALNDIYFAREMGIALDEFNHYGSSLIFGHPQGLTGMRLIIELIEELVLLGGSYGLFTGCAAGDTAAAIVIRVDNR